MVALGMPDADEANDADPAAGERDRLVRMTRSP
jgi:hypothetical protein